MSDALQILVVEDDNALRKALINTLTLAGFEAHGACSGEEAQRCVGETTYALVVSDINMPGMDGVALLRVLHSEDPGLPVLLMTAYGTITAAVAALQEGAVDYLTKPFTPDALLTRVLQYARRTVDKRDPVASAASTQRLLALARKVAVSDVTVLISGESGTGKEVLARYIHRHSERSDKPFVAINCAAIPENMLEAMLFGHEKGAYTGAHIAQAGKFEQAQGGTLLLDEISEMSLGLQAKLLRVLQEREVERLGGRCTISLDIRVLATSNRDLPKEVQAGRFREDLYYRLNVFPMNCTPLRERSEDIPELAEYFLQDYTSRGSTVPRLLPETAQKLKTHGWPGNVRELSNVIQRALVLYTGNLIRPDDIVFDTMPVFTTPVVDIEKVVSDLHSEVQQQEFEVIATTLRQTPSKKEAASRLGISDRTLRYKLSQMRQAGFLV